jgi:hypothetical protein
MSGITHPQIPIEQVLQRDQRRAKIIALAAVTTLAALLATLVLVVNGDDSPTAGTAEPAVQATQQPSVTQPGVRYDGGPEEGTAALTQRSAPATFDPNEIKNPPGQRFDGGPEETSVAAAIERQPAPAARPDESNVAAAIAAR